MSMDNNSDIAEMEPHHQIEIMREWFFAKYEDPVHSLPWDSEDKEYFWMFGGPYYADDVLQCEFGHSVPQHVIEEFTDELSGLGFEWSPILDADAYEQQLIGFLAENTEYFQKFETELLNNWSLLQLDVPDEVSGTLYRMIHINLITIMEAYLSDAFIGTVFQSEEFLKKFVKHTPEFQKKAIGLSEIYDYMANIDEIAKKYLSEVLWHRLAVVMNMYADTLGVSFPDDMSDIFRAIKQRHIFVHGKSDIEGQSVKKEDVVMVLKACRGAYPLR